MQVGFEDCRKELLDRAGGEASQRYREWRKRSGYGAVVEFVETFRHRYLYEITLEEIQALKKRSEHALGRVRKEEQLPEVEDFSTPYGLEHVFHKYLEQKRALPSWQEFRKWMLGPARQLYVTPLLEGTGWHAAGQERQYRLRRAYRWRLGKFYYAAVRDVELLTLLREQYGLPVRYHLLADLLLRVDLWLGDTLVCTYFRNPRYRSGKEGRKVHTERLFSRAQPPFNIVDIHIPRQGFGNFWGADPDSVRQLALTLSGS